MKIATKVVVLFFALSGCASIQSASATESSVCELADAQVSPDVVTIKAIYVDDGHHEPILADSSCPGKRLLPLLPENPDAAFDEITKLQPNVISGPRVDAFDIEVEGYLTKQGSSPLMGFQIVALKKLTRRQ